MMVYQEADQQLWDILSDVPRLTGVWPYVVFILNIVLPGVGSFVDGVYELKENAYLSL